MNFLQTHKCFQIVDEKLYCNVCNDIKVYSSNEGIRNLQRHVKSKKHMEAIKKGLMQLRLSCEKLPLNDSNIFHKDLLEALVSSNIPIHKITKEGFKAFLEKYTGRSINSDTFYRSTIIDQVYSKKFENVKSKFLNNEEFYLIFDESTDFKSRHILSLLIGCCSKLCRVDPYLLGIIKLDNVNSQAISSEILAKLTEFFDRNFNAV